MQKSNKLLYVFAVLLFLIFSWQAVSRVGRVGYRVPPIVVTIPEGFNVNQIADAAGSKLANFNKIKFLNEAISHEGYFFPDTYFFVKTDTEKEVMRSMTDNFQKKITPLFSEIVSSGKTEQDIIVMASIIEREAKGDADRAIIAGILWRRISIGMALQVDAASETYQTTGLPKSPIGNPGLEAIKAAIHSQSSPYLYYLHDKNGIIHYAKTFSEHIQNRLKYLR